MIDNNKMTEYSLKLIKMAFEEDLGANGDITSKAIFSNQKKKATLYAKADGIISGIEIFKQSFHYLDQKLVFTEFKKDGDFVAKQDKVLTIEGNFASILTAERTALNFLQRMSGISTKTHQIMQLLKDSKIKLLDTRKTLPAYRYLDKYAVLMGGGTNHRMGLYDLVMLKDNHIEASGSITLAVAKVREYLRKNNLEEIKIEVEVKNLTEFKEALAQKVDIIMLDNMSDAEILECTKLKDSKVKIEVSGNINKERIAKIKDFEIDYVSMGALTHSVKALDLSLLF